MKKVLFLMVFVLSLSFIMMGCQSNDAATGNETLVLKFGMVAGNQSNEYKAAEKFAEIVSANSDGSIKIELFPNSQLGDDRAMIEQVGAGVLDITLAETARLGIWEPVAELTGLSYMFDDYAHLRRVLHETDFGKELADSFYNKHNWKILANAYNGTRQTTSNKAINSIEDFRGVKLRTPQHQPLLDYAEYIGASPTPMAFTEVYLALQTNAVDAQENPLSTIKAVKFYEVQPYLAMTNHTINDVNYVFSKEKWSKMTDKQKEIVQKAATEAADFHTSLFETEEKELIAYFESKGVTVTYPDLAPFGEALKGSYQKYFDRISEGLDEALAAIEQAR